MGNGCNFCKQRDEYNELHISNGEVSLKPSIIKALNNADKVDLISDDVGKNAKNEKNLKNVKNVVHESEYNTPTEKLKNNGHTIISKNKFDSVLSKILNLSSVNKTEINKEIYLSLMNYKSELQNNIKPSNSNYFTNNISKSPFDDNPVKLTGESINIYYGSWNSKSQREDFGINIFQNNDIYKGNWHNDLMHKNGIYFKPNGNYYKGEFKNGVAEGLGELYLKDKNILYKGTFLNGELNGNGTEINYKDNITYTGEWVNGVKCGKFKIIDNDDESKYEGGFKNGKFNGNGILTFKDGKKYEGNFHNGKFHGFGIFTWPDGKMFKGNYNNGERKNGIFYWDKDNYYNGNWLNDQPNGEGEYHIDGEVKDVVYRFGKIISSGSLCTNDNS